MRKLLEINEMIHNVVVLINNFEHYRFIENKKSKNDDPGTFTREVIIKNNEEIKNFLYLKMERMSSIIDIKTSKITPLKKVININKRKLITLDIETISVKLKDGEKGKNNKFTQKMIPIFISYFDANEEKSFIEKDIRKWCKIIRNI